MENERGGYYFIVEEDCKVRRISKLEYFKLLRG